MTTAAATGREERERSPWRVFALVGGSSLLISLNYSLMFVAYGKMGETFDASAATLSWALTAYSITAASLMIPAGWLADRFGRKPVVVTGIGVFTFGSLVIGTAPVVGVLILGRVLQAVGLALETSAAFAVVIDEFPVDRRATAVGAMGASGGAAATIGPVIGGTLIDSIGWRATFLINVPLGVILTYVVWRNLRRDTPMGRRPVPDLWSVPLLAGGVGCLALAIVKSNTWGFGGGTLGLALAAVVLIGLLLRRSARHPDPILYLPMFKDPTFRRGVGLMFFLAGSFSSMFLTIIRTFTGPWEMSVASAGLAAAAIPLVAGPLSLVAGRVADRRGPRTVIPPGALVMTIGLLLYATRLTDHRSVLTVWLPAAFVYGIGVGFAHASTNAAAMTNVPADRLAVGAAMARIALDIGGVLFVATSIAVLDHADSPIEGARTVATIVAVVSFTGGLLALRLPKRTGPRPT